MKPWIIYCKTTGLFYQERIGSFRFVDSLSSATQFGDFEKVVTAVNMLNKLGADVTCGTLPVSFWYNQEVN